MGGIPREDIIARWNSLLGDTGYSWLNDLESDESKKIGPYSIMLPWNERRNGIYDYFVQNEFRGSEDAYSDAFAVVRSQLPKALRVSTLESAFEGMPRGTNWGLPLFTKRQESYPEYLLRAKEADSNAYQMASEVYPAVLFWRGQAQGLDLDPKQRDVWGVDHMPIIVGKTYVDPLLKALKYQRGFSAWTGFDEVDKRVTEMLERRLPIFSVDFSGFDKSANRRLIQSAYSLIDSCFSNLPIARLKFKENVFLTNSIVTPDGILQGRNGGVPSGIDDTNLIDTLINALAANYVAERMGIGLIHGEFMGDDGLWQFSEPVDLELVGLAVAELGLTLNTGKTSVSTDMVHFLQRVHHYQYFLEGLNRGVRSTMRTLGSMMSFERMRQGWTGEFNTLRWIMQVENTKWHPKFDEFVDFLRQGDEFLQDRNPIEILKAIGGWRGAEGVLGVTSFPWRVESLKGLASFRTVRELALLSKHQSGIDNETLVESER
jgi:hypothetical protein